MWEDNHDIRGNEIFLTLATAIALAVGFGSGFSAAQDASPNRLIKIIVPFGAGTTADLNSSAGCRQIVAAVGAADHH